MLPFHREIAALAVTRYPKMTTALAVLCFASDRRQAGLGALGGRQWMRNNRAVVRCFKERDAFADRVLYSRIIDIPARDEFPPPDDDWMSVGIDCAADLTVTLIRVPARFSHLCVKVDAKDFQSQRGRSLIAATLRSMRRQSLLGAQEKVG
jgi:hypothetical protein